MKIGHLIAISIAATILKLIVLASLVLAIIFVLSSCGTNETIEFASKQESVSRPIFCTSGLEPNTSYSCTTDEDGMLDCVEVDKPNNVTGTY